MIKHRFQTTFTFFMLSFILVLAVPCSAETASFQGYEESLPFDVSEEAPPPEIEETYPLRKPTEYKIRVVNEKGKPVTNLYIWTLNPNVADPGFDYSLLRTAGYTDEKGLFTLAPYTLVDFHLSADTRIDGDSKKYFFSEIKQVDGAYQVTWTSETPLELADTAENSFRLRVVEQSGKPVPGLAVSAVEKAFVPKSPEIKAPKVLDGYTDQNGYFSSLSPLDGSELRLCVSSERDGKKGITKYYSITPSPTGHSQYKITW